MATIYDVAQLAEVSPKTVSRVVNNDPAVRSTTRARVERAIEQLGYVPSLAARSIRSQRSGLLGLITGAISHDVVSARPSGLPELIIVQGIQSALANSGHTLLIADTGGDQSRVPALMRTLEEHRVEGLFFVADCHRRVELPAVNANTQLMLVNCFSESSIPAIVPDDFRGQYELVDRMLQAGHQRIGFISLPVGMEAEILRLKGYKAALQKHGIPFDPSLHYPLALDDEPGQQQLVWDSLDKLLQLDQPPTAICCGNDHIAVTVYGVLRSRGVSVPDQMSVAGYDNYRVLAETMFPPLTTAELPYRGMGALAAKHLLALIQGQDLPIACNPISVSGPVHWRDSVIPLKTQNITTIDFSKRTKP